MLRMDTTPLFSLARADMATIHSRTATFVHGPFGSGKTSLAIARARWLLQQERVRGDDLLILVPQRINMRPFQESLTGKNAPPGAPIEINTYVGIVHESVQLYWPLISASANFLNPHKEPTFLGLEMTQYHVGQFVDQALARQEFSGIVAKRNRIVIQILSNLNRAVYEGASLDETYDKLIAALGERREAGQVAALEAARRISHRFHDFCLAEGMLDLSMQVKLFTEGVLMNEWSRTHLLRSKRHLIADNMEEDTPAGHKLIADWARHLDSLLVCVDDDGGFRTFLGADPEGAQELEALCTKTIHLNASFHESPAVHKVAAAYSDVLPARQGMRQTATTVAPPTSAPADEADKATEQRRGLAVSLGENGETYRFYPQMIRGVARDIADLVHGEGVEPGSIAVVAPIISDSLRFGLQNELTRLGIPSTGHRPSRALEDEPATRTLLTLAKLAHPHWNLRPPAQDVAQAFAFAIDVLDPIRAALLVTFVYPQSSPSIDLRRFADLPPEARRRITYAAGEGYDTLRDWLYAWRAGSAATGEGTAESNAAPIDHTLDSFLARLFEQVLSQPGYGFRERFDAIRVAHQVVDAARRLRWALEPADRANREDAPRVDVGREFVHTIDLGVLGGLYVPAWRVPQDAVLISPVLSFLLRNTPVRHQFWLDVGSQDWWERLYQPLTHPYVLGHRWQPGRAWQDEDEGAVRASAMRRQTLGLLRRTTEQVHLAISEYSESGAEQQGPLLKVTNRVLARSSGQ
jgi:hypothetical protein